MSKKQEMTATMEGQPIVEDVALVPSYLHDAEPTGLAEVNRFIVPPRLKIVQKQSKDDLRSVFNEGDIIAVPMRHLISPIIVNDKGKPTDEGEPFHFIPLFFFAEWCLWNPYEMASTLPAIAKRTINPRDEIAVKARNPETRQEPFLKEDGKPHLVDNKPQFRRYVEHLNFLVCIIGDNPFAGIPVLLTFARGEHRSGTNFAASLAMRRLPNGKAPPIFSTQFEARAKKRPDNPKGQWYGIDVSNPSPGSGVSAYVQDQKQYELLREKHLELEQAHKEMRLVADYDPDVVDAVNNSPGGAGPDQPAQY